MPVTSPRHEMVLFTLAGANMNSTADQALTRQFNFTTFRITQIRVDDASVSLTTAAGGIYTAASKGGIAVVAAGQTYSALTSANRGMNLTLEPVGLDRLAATTLFLSLTTGQGSAAVASFQVIGIPFT